MALEGLVRHDGRRRRVVSMVSHEADHSQTELALVVYLLIITSTGAFAVNQRIPRVNEQVSPVAVPYGKYIVDNLREVWFTTMHGWMRCETPFRSWK